MSYYSNAEEITDEIEEWCNNNLKDPFKFDRLYGALTTKSKDNVVIIRLGYPDCQIVEVVVR